MTEESSVLKGADDVAPSGIPRDAGTRSFLRICPIIFLDVELLRLKKPHHCL